ncbi:MAG: STAS domain-containing protein [Pirellulaceae bacterium]|jgi:anti-sigma B factor antagonist
MSKRIELSLEGNVTVATLKDCRLTDELIIHESINELVELVASREHPQVIIDFTEVEFLSTAFLGGLISVKKSAATHDTMLKLAGISACIMEAIYIVGFDRNFDIEPTVAGAVKAFK